MNRRETREASALDDAVLAAVCADLEAELAELRARYAQLRRQVAQSVCVLGTAALEY